jgi:hypothetical protein
MLFILSVANKPFVAECHYAECRYAECRGAVLKNDFVIKKKKKKHFHFFYRDDSNHEGLMCQQADNCISSGKSYEKFFLCFY